MTDRDDRTVGHLDYLDGWRGVAILLVICSHFFNFAGGRLGVEVFFVLSGLLMSRILFETDISIGTFYRRRIARIVPVFLLYLVVVAIAAAWSPPAMTPKGFLYALLMIQSYAPSGTIDPQIPIGHLWSLNVEEHSYVLLSLVAVATRRRWPACIALTLAAIVCVVMYGVQADLGTIGTRRTECAAFALLSSAALYLARPRLKRPDLLFAGGTALVVASFVLSRAIGSSIYLDYVAKPFGLAIMVNCLHAAPGVVRRALSTRWLRWFGATSFSLYLWQQPFFEGVLNGRLPTLVGLAGAIGVGFASFHLFETPMRNLIRNWRMGGASTLASS